MYHNKSHLFDSKLKNQIFDVNTFDTEIAREKFSGNLLIIHRIHVEHRAERVQHLWCQPKVGTMSFETDAKSLTDDLPVCPETGHGFAINQTYKEDGTRQKVHKIYDRSCYSQQIDTQTLVRSILWLSN